MNWFTRYPAIDLTGAVVAVTGGARGIGRATAEALARRGAWVAIGDLDADLAAATSAALGERVRGYQLDVTRRASFARFLDLVERELGPVDVLVNNAGIMPIDRFLDEPDHISATTVEVNVWGPLLGMRLALPGMLERGRGHIVNVASLAGKTHLPGLAVYSASKFAVVGMSAAVRGERTGTGVSVSTVLPSMVRTELASGIAIPAPLAVEPEDVARAIVRSVASRRPEISVPGWVGHAVALANLLPASLQRLARRAVSEDRGLRSLTDPARAGYIARVDGQAQRHDRPGLGIRPTHRPTAIVEGAGHAL